MTRILIEDNEILWLQREKVGNPPSWEPGKNYSIGDIIVPRNPTAAQANVMFQAIAFLAKTGATEPVWPTGAKVGDTVVSGDIEFVAQTSDQPPAQLSENQYFIFDRTITVT